MPEGPEVRRCADILSCAIAGKKIREFEAHTKNAQEWLSMNSSVLNGRSIESIRSRGKLIVGKISGGYYFVSHLYIWGRWMLTARGIDVDTRRQQRARMVFDDVVALLCSTTSFDIGEGDPMVRDTKLRVLGPDTLPYDDEPGFDAAEFLRRLNDPNHRRRPIGLLLLDQTISCGIGNYLRAEILFDCHLDPWRSPESLLPDEEASLVRSIVHIVRLSYINDGILVLKSVTESQSVSQSDSQSKVLFAPTTIRSYEFPLPDQDAFSGATESDSVDRYYVYGRSGKACRVCGNTIHASKRLSGPATGGESPRTIFYCPTCQKTRDAIAS